MVRTIGLALLISSAILATGLVDVLLQYPLITMGAFTVSAIVLRIRSKIDFLIVLFLVVAVPVLVLTGNDRLADYGIVFALYALFMGVWTAVISQYFGGQPQRHD